MRVAYDYSYLDVEEIPFYKPFKIHETKTANFFEEKFNMYYKMLIDYKNEFGNLLVNDSYMINNYNLGKWVSKQRWEYNRNALVENRVKMLNDIGFVWSIRERFDCATQYTSNSDKMFQQLNQYVKENGNCDVPRRYIINGIKLGQWLATKKSKQKIGKLNKDIFEKLDTIGFRWDNKVPKTNWIQLMAQFKEDFGTYDISTKCVFKGNNLGQWLASQKTFYFSGIIKAEILLELTNIGFVFQRKNAEYKRSKKCEGECKCQLNIRNLTD